MVTHAYNSITLEAESEGSLGVQGQTWLQSELKVSLNTEKTCLTKKKKKTVRIQCSQKMPWATLHFTNYDISCKYTKVN